jgi:hypothetical protein
MLALTLGLVAWPAWLAWGADGGGDLDGDTCARCLCCEGPAVWYPSVSARCSLPGVGV